MSGDATFSGTGYQARVIAFVFVHVLTETKLRWLPVANDTPSAVSGEVKGPGDDARIEFSSGAAPIEIQAKHGLKPQRCIEAFQNIGNRSAPKDETPVMLVVDSSSSASIRGDLRRDLDRMRAGRRDGLKALTKEVMAALGAEADAVMDRVRVLTLDVDVTTDAGTGWAIEALNDSLEDPSQATAVWGLLENEAAAMCAERSRRDRRALMDILEARGVTLRPPKQTRKWHDDLRYSKKLLDEAEPALAMALLKEIEADLTRSGVQDGTVLYRLSQHRAAALLLLGRYAEAIDAAQRALDHDPRGVHALVNLANAQALSGAVDAARVTAMRATDSDPQAPIAWLIRLQVSLEDGQPEVMVPPDVAATTEFRTGLIQIKLLSGDAREAREVAAALIQEGNRSARLLLLRVEGLLADIDDAHEERLTRAQEIERLSSEVLNEASGLAQRLIQRALVTRSAARRILGRIEDAQDDSQRAHALYGDDAGAIAEAAQASIQSGDEDAALELLLAPVIDEHPFLLAMRASLLASRGQPEKARKDLDAVLQAIPGFHQPDMLRSAAAEAALHLEDIGLAKKLVAEMEAVGTHNSVHHSVTLARIAVLEGDFTAAENHYRQAANVDAPHRAAFFAELGSRLLSAKQPRQAVSVFREAQPLPPGAERAFVHALVEADEMAEAHANLERLASQGSMPDWAVAFAAQIALRRNDPKKAAEHLEDLFTRGSVTPDGRLTLTKTLLELEQHERARFHALALILEQGLTARERMFLAQLLLHLGDANRAIEQGLRAYRDAPDDADINRAFCSIVFLSKTAPEEYEEVRPGTHVLLKSDDGGTLEYLVFANRSGQGLPKEISLDAATAAGLIGLRTGDVLLQDKGAWFEKRWRVERIESAVRYLANDIIANYGTRFPGASFFAVGFHFNTEHPGIRDFQPLISSAHERDRQQREILDLYQEQCLPLAVIAKVLAVSVPSLIQELTRGDGERPFYVEWSDAEGRVGSREAARLQTPTVLTRSALFSAQRMNLLPLLARDRACIGPRSLRDEIRGELADAEERLRDGWHAIVTSERGVALETLEAGHPVLVKQRDLVRGLLDWADVNLTFLPRPLQAFADQRLRGPEMRSRLGESSNDALELALFTPGVLYADDLGLRRLSQGLEIRSLSTVSLVQVWAEVGAVSPHERDRLLVALAERHYYAIEATPEMLVEAFAPGRSVQDRRAVFSLLAAPYLDANAATRTVVRAVRVNALSAVKIATTKQIVGYGLEVMSLRFPVSVLVQLASRFADLDLALLPNDQRAVKALCIEFRKKREAF